MTKTKDWSFLSHINNYLETPKLGDPREPSLFPSEASAVITEGDEAKVVGACRRATFFRYLVDNYNYNPDYSSYKLLAEEIQSKISPPSRYMRWIWLAGELYEQKLIDLAKESGIFVATQAPLYIRDFKVSGKRDLIVLNPYTAKFKTVEAKSVYGFGSTATIGKSSVKGWVTGEPRSSNLMQIALYDWWGSSHDERFENSSLVYGARDTGTEAEYEIETRTVEEEIEIWWKPIEPVRKEFIRSPITINNILSQYQFVQMSLDSGNIPKRDYRLQYTTEEIQKLYEADELGKTDKERHEKWLAYQRGENKRKIMPVEKGDWQCDLCKFKRVCYEDNEEKTPRNL